MKSVLKSLVVVMGLAALGALGTAHAQAFKPSKPIEVVVHTGPGGGNDVFIRAVLATLKKDNLTQDNFVVVNKSGGAGAEGFLNVKSDSGNPHKIIITLSNLFTTPLATGVPFNWRDLTPVQMLALDQFVLWVNEESPHKTAKAYIDAVKAQPDNTFKMGGTGSKQEDQIITVLVQKVAGKKITYIPFKGGGDVAVQLVGNHVNSTVNNPIEAESHWRAGKLRALCVMDKQAMPYKTKVTATQSWADIPTCTSAGIPVDYLMLRGIFMAPGVTPDQVAFYLDLFKKVRALPEWKEFMDKGAFNQTALTGQEFFDWLGRNEQMHRVLMKEAGVLAN